MRCKKHFSDKTSSVGVCATCLRESLFSLALEQAQTHTHITPPSSPHPVFSGTVSPHTSDIVSPSSTQQPKILDQRFFSTPQVLPTHRTKKPGKFSLISIMFRSRLEKSDLESQSTLSSPNRLPRRKNKHTNSLPPRRPSNRGMSPDSDSSPGNPSEKWSKPRSRRRRGDSGTPYGAAFCLSPLVWASPGRRQTAVNSSETVYPADARRGLAAAASSGANRSRKFADFGRLNRF